MEITKVWTLAEWEEACCGYQDEHYIVAAIKKHLLTQAQREAMFVLDVSIEDCLNGRYTMEKATVIDKIYIQWNNVLGWREFGC